MADLDSIRRRVSAAGSQPWQRHGCDVWQEGAQVPIFRGRDGQAEDRHQADLDAEFVVHAREDIIDLLALLDQLTARSAPTAQAASGTSSTPETVLAAAPGPFSS